MSKRVPNLHFRIAKPAYFVTFFKNEKKSNDNQNIIAETLPFLPG